MPLASSPRFSVFRFVQWGCVGFVLLTALAMLFYPGGTSSDQTAKGYHFFRNFFSDLGRIHAHNGAPNPISATFFFIALAGAGVIMVVFFVAFARFFNDSPTLKGLSWLGSAWGSLSGICFAGVACTPADVSGHAHGRFVIWAFRTFLLAVIIYSAVIWRSRHYPKAYAWVFVAFAALLAGYIWLLTSGPNNLVIQATGQKVIVYASLLSVAIQAGAAHRTLRAAAPK